MPLWPAHDISESVISFPDGFCSVLMCGIELCNQPSVGSDCPERSLKALQFCLDFWGYPESSLQSSANQFIRVLQNILMWASPEQSIQCTVYGCGVFFAKLDVFIKSNIGHVRRCADCKAIPSLFEIILRRNVARCAGSRFSETWGQRTIVWRAVGVLLVFDF